MRRMSVQSIGLVLFFVLCQVTGAMCVMPTVSLGEQPASLIGDVMVCPMDGTVMCPPSATSSPERQGRQGSVEDIDYATPFLTASLDSTTRAIPTLCLWSRALSIVPTSIGSSLVLRI
jgi:hypothetical protein